VGKPPRRVTPPGQGLDLGRGPALVLLHGFGLQPRTYLRTASALAEHFRVLVPPLFVEPAGTWTPQRAIERVRRQLGERDVGAVIVVAHSFGGALALELATAHPEQVRELIFVDTLAMSREWTLAAEAVHPLHLLWMATPRATLDFTRSILTHPLCLTRAGWWGFRSDRRRQVDAVRAAAIPSHVLWASRDSLLTQSDGRAFADDLGADFEVVSGADGRPIDHDWLYRHPQLLVEVLARRRLPSVAPWPGGAAGAPGSGGVLASSNCVGATDPDTDVGDGIFPER